MSRFDPQERDEAFSITGECIRFTSRPDRSRPFVKIKRMGAGVLASVEWVASDFPPGDRDARKLRSLHAVLCHPEGRFFRLEDWTNGEWGSNFFVDYFGVSVHEYERREAEAFHALAVREAARGSGG